MIKSFEEIRNKAYEPMYSEYLEDIDAYGFVLKHVKSGARVCIISCEDDNKVFFAGFRTSPKDSTGVAHIIEHTVLCGSEKYPIKDPFEELCKGSLNTFMNALTYPDKTVYPVASCNDKDFANIMSVYMDAVFRPLIYRDKNRFLQEGWRYELEDENAPLTVNGVVYSEMKGVYSDPEEILNIEILNRLYPNTAYGVDYGGSPEHIPELTYEEYLLFHKTHYHPSNSYLFLYGNMDVEERLDFMDREYLSAYNALSEDVVKDTEIGVQPPFGGIKDETAYYNIADDASEENSSFLSVNLSIGSCEDLLLQHSIRILKQALFDVPGAPVKQALLDSGVAEDFFAAYSTEMRQPYLSFVARNANSDSMGRFVSVLRKALETQVREGINEKSLLAAINQDEFGYREADFGGYPKGLIYGLEMMTTWLHDDAKAFETMKASKIFAILKEKVGTGYYEEVVRTYMLGSKHELRLCLAPKKGLLAEQTRKLEERLEGIREQMSPSTRRRVVGEYKELLKFQETEDSKEALATIPRLSLDDVNKTVKPIEYEEEKLGQTPFVFSPSKTAGIGYFKILLDMGELTEEEISYSSLLANILGKIATEQYSYFDLSNEVNICSGGMGTFTATYSKAGDYKHYRPVFYLNGKLLYDDTDRALGLAEEILLHSDFTDRKRIKELIVQIRAKLQASIAGTGHVIALKRVLSYLTSDGLFDELSAGLSYYRFICGLAEQFDDMADEICGKLESLYRRIVCKENALYLVTAEKKQKEAMQKCFERFGERLPHTDKPAAKEGRSFELPKPAEGLTTAGMVQYVVLANNFLEKGYEYKGSLQVLKQIFENEYLYENVRLKNGAYGSWMSMAPSDGTIYLMSYRDPKLRETLDIYKALPDAVAAFEADDEQMENYIIGTIGSADMPLTPSQKGNRDFIAYMTGLTEEKLQERRDQILATTAEEIRGCADLIRTMVESGSICVVGGEEMINKCKDLFRSVDSCL